MLSLEQLNILACPGCKGKLTQHEQGQYLLCRPCGLRFPVRSGIPVMLLDEAEACGDQGPETGDREAGF